eukprot:NODE_613_length_1912_cov_46.159957_g491_i0.p1 GENE.NODE_613_length_1912_cov_46.159957_g491_i0~~NODE_613_length_1912_cov_46.159957_g491_i0.p1  ORF type:complete len:592 (+),score=164.16 NODE_613_length_1912_cov_46.159957_g491_i0:29-1777(+)
MQHLFGNYVVQKLLQHGTQEQTSGLIQAMKGHVLDLTLQTYGCRVVQRALEVATNNEMAMISRELEGNLIKCVENQNGNHVIQKLVERLQPSSLGFLIGEFRNSVERLAIHLYGCRVIQRLIEHCAKNPTHISSVIKEIKAALPKLITDQYGNYVVQHALAIQEVREDVLPSLRNGLLGFSQHKYASNVVEKLFVHSTSKEKIELTELLLDTLTPPTAENPQGVSAIVAMAKDPYSNYVVQRALDELKDIEDGAATREKMINVLTPHVGVLKKLPSGKHIINKMNPPRGGGRKGSYGDRGGGGGAGFGDRRQQRSGSGRQGGPMGPQGGYPQGPHGGPHGGMPRGGPGGPMAHGGARGGGNEYYGGGAGGGGAGGAGVAGNELWGGGAPAAGQYHMGGMGAGPGFFQAAYQGGQGAVGGAGQQGQQAAWVGPAGPAGHPTGMWGLSAGDHGTGPVGQPAMGPGEQQWNLQQQQQPQQQQQQQQLQQQAAWNVSQGQQNQSMGMQGAAPAHGAGRGFPPVYAGAAGMQPGVAGRPEAQPFYQQQQQQQAQQQQWGAFAQGNAQEQGAGYGNAQARGQPPQQGY